MATYTLKECARTFLHSVCILYLLFLMLFDKVMKRWENCRHSICFFVGWLPPFHSTHSVDKVYSSSGVHGSLTTSLQFLKNIVNRFLLCFKKVSKLVGY